MCSSLTELEDNERSKVDEVLDRINRRMGTWLVIFARLRISLGILAGDPARVLRLYRDLKTQGLRATARRIALALQPNLPEPKSLTFLRTQIAEYRKWVELYDTISPQEAKAIRDFVATLAVKPKFSILVPVYETPEQELRQMIASVKEQIYDDWELCIADDASRRSYIRRILEEEAQAEPRIILVFREENGNICAASNSALALASGDFIALLDHDDKLAPHALAIWQRLSMVIRTLTSFTLMRISSMPMANVTAPISSRTGIQNSSTVKISSVIWASTEPRYCESWVAFALGFEGSQDYDLALRATATTKGSIVHVPHVLYHWRVYAGAGNFSSTQLERSLDAARRAIKEQFATRGVEVSVRDAGHYFHRILRKILRSGRESASS